jgi:hypothetical protein
MSFDGKAKTLRFYLELEEDDPLLRTIYRRSDAELRDCIATLSAHEILSMLNSPKYVCALASWCGALQFLVSRGLISTASNLTKDLWKAGLRIGDSESLEVLLELKVQIKLGDWYTIVRTWGYYHGPVSTDEQAQRGKVLYAIAKRLVPSNITSSSQDCEGHEDVIGTLLEDPPLYHSRHLSVLTAECAWAAGCRNLNSAHWEQGFIYTDMPWIHGTPLWLQTIESALSSQRIWPIVEWFLNHGVDITWTHPVLFTTPAHVIVRKAFRYLNYESPLGIFNDLRSSLILTGPDLCTCHCSKSGCYAIGCAVQKQSIFLQRGHVRQTVQAHIFALVEHHRKAVWMSSAVLRVLTFEELSLTHTCCYRVLDEVHGLFTRPTHDEAKDIHNHERTDIDLLGILVDEFEAKWATYTKSFVTFMSRVWKPRMKAVRQGQQVDKKTYESELCRMGVSLQELGDENVSDSESDWDWSDDSREGDVDGWYTTDEEDGDGAEEVEEGEVNDVGPDED